MLTPVASSPTILNLFISPNSFPRRIPLYPMPPSTLHPVTKYSLALKQLENKYGFVTLKDAPEPLTNYLDVSSTVSITSFPSPSLEIPAYETKNRVHT